MSDLEYQKNPSSRTKPRQLGSTGVAQSAPVRFEVAFLNMHYEIKCSAKALHAITPQDIFNLVLEDTSSAFATVPTGGADKHSPSGSRQVGGKRPQCEILR